MELGESELGGAVDGDEQVEAAFLGADFGDVDVKVTDRVSLELTAAWFVAFMRDAGQNWLTFKVLLTQARRRVEASKRPGAIHRSGGLANSTLGPDHTAPYFVLTG